MKAQISRLLSTLAIAAQAAVFSNFAATPTTGDALNMGTGNVLSTLNHSSAFPYNTIAGGSSNTNNADLKSAIGGGTANMLPESLTFNFQNVSSGGTTTRYVTYSAIPGGYGNYVGDGYSVVGGGTLNLIYPTNRLDSSGAYLPTEGTPWGGGSQIDATYSVIAGGSGNRVNTINSAIGGGADNRIDANSNYSVVSGGLQNGIGYQSGYSVISGGSENVITNGAWWGSINGGAGNMVIGPIPATSPLTVWTNQTDFGNPFHFGWIGGGWQNIIYPGGVLSSIGAGQGNYIKSSTGVIGGGYFNEIEESAPGSVIGGGQENEISDDHGFIGGGYANLVSASFGTISGGSENLASGVNSTIPGGAFNTAAGQFSFAAGYRAKANHNGTFVWGDFTGNDIASSGAGQFIARATGGFWFGDNSSPSFTAGHLIDTSSGAYLTTGGAWTSVSDRNKKHNFQDVDVREILAKVKTLPVKRWSYKAEDESIRHIGPVAQDFGAAFLVGEDDRHISTIDADGVAIAAIKGLAEVVEEKEKRIDELEARLKAIEVALNRN